jgi:hypothetical protein
MVDIYGWCGMLQQVRRTSLEIRELVEKNLITESAKNSVSG